ncbi:hypothetical protein B0T17DRAFT_509143 [Bombardia bombarda]|uniref:Uncharacterized protein n=1 Tax=Bombardia bombarda TaxID=252184 RepID=A0AA39WUF5_9PEZI|nr:hypothetical protein B0T17DRAFT_509143 [Bombardia bombarda]
MDEDARLRMHNLKQTGQFKHYSTFITEFCILEERMNMVDSPYKVFLLKSKVVPSLVQNCPHRIAYDDFSSWNNYFSVVSRRLEVVDPPARRWSKQQRSWT